MAAQRFQPDIDETVLGGSDQFVQSRDVPKSNFHSEHKSNQNGGVGMGILLRGSGAGTFIEYWRQKSSSRNWIWWILYCVIVKNAGKFEELLPYAAPWTPSWFCHVIFLQTSIKVIVSLIPVVHLKHSISWAVINLHGAIFDIVSVCRSSWLTRIIKNTIQTRFSQWPCFQHQYFKFTLNTVPT